MKIIKKYYPEVKQMTYICNDTKASYKFDMTTEEHNECILKDFYEAVEWLLKKGYEEYREIISRTINPAEQNAFLPLREYRILKNGHYKIFKIYTRLLGGWCITEEKI
jgi:hypothetical protein